MAKRKTNEGGNNTSRVETAIKNGGGKRVRRTAEDAKRQILDAAEKRLSLYGPEGVRLKEIAKDVGVSHPTILHHFENREGLVVALIDRTADRLREALLHVLEASRTADFDANDAIDKVFTEMSVNGTARLWAWMQLTGYDPTAHHPEKLLEEVGKHLHALRITIAKERSLPTPPKEDTQFVTLLVTLAAFADGIVGKSLAEGAGLDEAARQRFRRWLSALCLRHLLAGR